MQLPPYLGHEYHLSDVSLRLPGSFGWSIGCLLFLFPFHQVFMFLFALVLALTFDFVLVCWFSLTMIQLTWIFFLILHNHFIFDRGWINNLVLNLLLKIEEAVLNLFICLSFAILQRFFFTRTLGTPGGTAAVPKARVDSNADIAGQTWAFRILKIWIECLGQIELFLIHWIKLKTWCWNWLEGLWVE